MLYSKSDWIESDLNNTLSHMLFVEAESDRWDTNVSALSALNGIITKHGVQEYASIGYGDNTLTISFHAHNGKDLPTAVTQAGDEIVRELGIEIRPDDDEEEDAVKADAFATRPFQASPDYGFRFNGKALRIYSYATMLQVTMGLGGSFDWSDEGKGHRITLKEMKSNGPLKYTAADGTERDGPEDLSGLFELSVYDPKTDETATSTIEIGA